MNPIVDATTVAGEARLDVPVADHVIGLVSEPVVVDGVIAGYRSKVGRIDVTAFKSHDALEPAAAGDGCEV